MTFQVSSKITWNVQSLILGPVDIWAAGCDWAEMLRGKIIFLYVAEQNQLIAILNILGSHGIGSHRGYEWLNTIHKDSTLSDLFEAHPPLAQMLQFQPANRSTALQLSKHPYFGNPEGAKNHPRCYSMFTDKFGEEEFLNIVATGRLYDALRNFLDAHNDNLL